ncbi:unnamed protein product [Closterium sp. NIES-64]|nr:unnamed protein product [Closterium sp. NIES-64]
MGYHSPILHAATMCTVTTSWSSSWYMMTSLGMLPTLNAAGGVVLLEHITPALHALKPHLLSFHHHLPFSSAWGPSMLPTLNAAGDVCMGPSMLPTLNAAGDVVLLEHITPALHALKPGDIVVAKSPSNPRMMVCKRVVAMEGH